MKGVVAAMMLPLQDAPDSVVEEALGSLHRRLLPHLPSLQLCRNVTEHARSYLNKIDASGAGGMSHNRSVARNTLIMGTIPEKESGLHLPLDTSHPTSLTLPTPMVK